MIHLDKIVKSYPMGRRTLEVLHGVKLDIAFDESIFVSRSIQEAEETLGAAEKK